MRSYTEDKNSKEIIKTYSLIYKDFYNFDRQQIKNKKKVILKNLRQAKIYKFNNKQIMDVGTGIQSYVFSLLGFKKIYHYDINPIPVKKLNSLKSSIVSKQLHLGKQKLDRKFDFIYISGVIQHVKNYNYFLENVDQYLNKNGKVFFRIYRSGSFAWFIVEFLRKFIFEKNYLKKKF